jgi:hypothetical protein
MQHKELDCAGEHKRFREMPLILHARTLIPSADVRLANRFVAAISQCGGGNSSVRRDQP